MSKNSVDIISLRVSEQQHADLFRLACTDAITIAAEVRRACDAYLQATTASPSTATLLAQPMVPPASRPIDIRLGYEQQRLMTARANLRMTSVSYEIGLAIEELLNQALERC